MTLRRKRGADGENMKILDYNEIDKNALFLRRLEDSGVEEIVRGILADVAQNKDRALYAYAKSLTARN